MPALCSCFGICLLIVSMLMVTGAVDAACNADTCLHALRASSHSAEAQSLCATFTISSVPTATVPEFVVAASRGDVMSRVGSACSCIATATSTSPNSLTSMPSVPSTAGASTNAPSGVTTGPKSCLDPKISCQNTTMVGDLCCFNAPGGQLLLTQFWDTAPSTGPNNSWTIHGLWPDHCDGSYDANCDASREYTNISAILRSHGKTNLLAYMSTFWKDYQGNDESFWEHEWNKHGTCISTLEPKCYNGYTGQEEVVDYFEVAVELFKGLDSYAVLEKAGIIPSTTTTYNLSHIQDALSTAHGYPVTIACSSGRLDEIWYHFNVLGSVATGEFIPAPPDGSKSDCATAGISYVPKYLPATSTSRTSQSGSSPTGTPFSGKGFLQAYTGGANKGCLISAGTWYTSGTCATYTAAARTSGTGFTLTSSKGPCDVIAGVFSCATGNTVGTFTNVAGSLAYSGSAEFYAAAVPAGAVQQSISTHVGVVEVTFAWQII